MPPRALAADQVVFATSSDGTRIACRGQGTGPPLLLVHGSGEDHRRWRRVGGALSGHFRVHAMDRRARGASDDHVVHDLGREADDIAAVLALIGEPAHLLGHSYGALCCMEAVARGVAVRTLAMHEPCLPYADEPGPSPLAVHLQTLLERGDRERVVVTFFEEVLAMPPSQVSLLCALPAFPALVASAHTLVRELVATECYRFEAARFGGLDAPVLLLVSAQLDSRFLSAAVRAIMQAIPGATLTSMPVQQHRALDAAPLDVRDALLRFVTRAGR